MHIDAAEREELLEVGRAAGLDVVGVAPVRSWSANRAVIEDRRELGLAADMAFTYRNPPRSTEPHRLLRSAASLVVGALNYDSAAHPGLVPDEVTEVTARVARYAAADHYEAIRVGLSAVAVWLTERGARARVLVDDNGLLDREAAWRAGLGWYGKNSLILVPGQGSWFVLGSVVTDAHIVAEPAPVPDRCGGCDRCVQHCPTAAIVAPGVVDARRCLSWLLQAPGPFPEEFRTALGDRIYGCDDCQEVCPPNRTHELRVRRHGDSQEHGQHREPADGGRTVDVVAWLDLDDAALLERCGGWYIANRDPAIVRRNLLVILGNAAPVDSTVAADLLARYATHSDPVLASHAQWAQAELHRRAALAAEDRSGEDGTP